MRQKLHDIYIFGWRYWIVIHFRTKFMRKSHCRRSQRWSWMGEKKLKIFYVVTKGVCLNNTQALFENHGKKNNLNTYIFCKRIKLFLVFFVPLKSDFFFFLIWFSHKDVLLWIPINRHNTDNFSGSK